MSQQPQFPGIAGDESGNSPHHRRSSVRRGKRDPKKQMLTILLMVGGGVLLAWIMICCISSYLLSRNWAHSNTEMALRSKDQTVYLRVPQNWVSLEKTVEEKDADSVIAMGNPFTGASVIVHDFSENFGDTSRDEAGVPFPQYLDDEAFKALTDVFVAGNRIKRHASESISVGGFPAISYDVTLASDGDLPIRSDMVFVKTDTRIYLINLNCVERKNDYARPYLDKVLQSIRFQ